MDILAKTLNETLKGCSIHSMLSDYGRRMYVPKGIIVQSGEAKTKATRFNATIGTAMEHKSVMYIGGMVKQFADTMKPGEIFPYSPMGGNASLRKVWKDEMVRKNPLLEGKKTSLPIVCSGLTNALSIVASLFLDKGDSIVLPSMYWENYDLIIDEQRQARKVLFDTFADGAFNVAGLDAAISRARGRKVVLLLNFPNNPTGYTPTNTESDAIAAVLKKHADKGRKIVVISDDAYFGLFFDKDVCRQSLFAKICDASENLLAVKCDAATKEEMVWGFRIAFITYAMKGATDEQLDAICQKTMGVIRGTISNCSTPAQNILLKGMLDESYHADKATGIENIARRYDNLKAELAKYADQDCLVPYPFNSGYFMSFWTKCDADQLRLLLLDKYGTGTIRLGDHLLRIAFSSVDADDVAELVKVLYQAASELC